MKKFRHKALALTGLVAATTMSASAAVDVLGQQVELDTAPVIAMAGAIVLAIASIWAIKKVIAVGNKS